MGKRGIIFDLLQGREPQPGCKRDLWNHTGSMAQNPVDQQGLGGGRAPSLSREMPGMESKLRWAGGAEDATGQPQLMSDSGRFWGELGAPRPRHTQAPGRLQTHPQSASSRGASCSSPTWKHLQGRAHSHPTAHGDPKPASCSSDLRRRVFLKQGDVWGHKKGWDTLSPRSFTACDMPQ